MKRDGTPECVLAIYDRPRDFPDHVVVRLWQFSAEGKLTPQQGVTTFDVNELTHRGAVSAARTYCKRMGLSFLPRDRKDDPVLIESWRGRPQLAQAAE
jgi:hypothetical protein